MLSFQQARQKVIEVVAASSRTLSSEVLPLSHALQRILAQPIAADRDYPPFDRSTRDGFAVRSADLTRLPATLPLAGEIKAGDTVTSELRPGTCIQIMTGAAVPPGADAVVMIEHTKHTATQVTFDRSAEPGQNIVLRGSEAKSGRQLLAPGTRLGYAELAVAAQSGHSRLSVFARPRVAILSTGDEVVSIDQTPGAFQIRNSNSVSLAAQVTLAGAEPIPLGNAPDREPELRALIERGIEAEILVLSGGVSAGKYDLVETVLRDLGTEFFFDAVAIRPGRPAVFGRCRNRFVFGLPGNPVSTMVTFELFVVPAIDLLCGTKPRPLPLFKARLAQPIRQKAALTHFLPAHVSWPAADPIVEEIPSQGSGDIAALAAANCFLVVHPDHLELPAGEWVDVLPRRDIL